MAFNTALSGLRAADQDLSVTGNNIANASSVGFKRSRAEFGDVYASSQLGGGGNQAGNGVFVNNIAQQFDQGNISFTDNSLDLAINGDGFFLISEAGVPAYTRAGLFGVDGDGYITTSGNSRLQGYLADDQGVIQVGNVGDLQLSQQSLAPQLTQQVDISFNLDSGDDIPAVSTFSPTNPDSYNTSSSLTTFDSQGNAHRLTQYFVKLAPDAAAVPAAIAENTWDLFIQIDDEFVGLEDNSAANIGGAPVTSAYRVTYDAAGEFAGLQVHVRDAADNLTGLAATNPPNTIQIDNWEPRDATGAFNGAITNTGLGITDPATSSSFQINIANSTQFSNEFATSAISQDGFSQGRLATVEVDETGVIFARYTNGEAQSLGQVILASFSNVQGLTPLGDSAWAESFESGAPLINEPLSGSLGAIQSGALEDSNVDISEELVRLIIAQRNYQANARTIETADTVTQAILNI